MPKTRCRKPIWTKTYTDWDQVPLLMTVQEVCILIRRSDETVRQMIKDGTLKGITEGHRFLVTKQSVMDLIH